MLCLSESLSVPRLRKFQDREEIFDPCRRKWVTLTSEEWTRQRLLQQFTEIMNIPAAWIAVEKEIEVNGLRKRYDILVHDQRGLPWILVECKSAETALNAGVMEQLLRYHIRIPADFLIICNGNETRCWEKTPQGLCEITYWPVLRN